MSPDPVLFNDFRRQWDAVGARVLEAVREVGEGGVYILGEHVRTFEAELARYLGRRFVVGCASGLDAIELALRALGLRPGQKVLTTPTTAFATTLGILRAGGVPVYVDVDESGLLDLELARAALKADREIRFLVPVHLFGHALDLEHLQGLAAEFDVGIVEDCCQAIGASWAGRPVGSVGQASAMSFYPTKNLGALGDAGALLTDDPRVHRLVVQLRNYGQSARFEHEHIGLNSRLDELQAAALTKALLPELTRWTARRRAIAERYLTELRQPYVRPLPVPAKSESVWHLFPVAVEPQVRDALSAHLTAHGVQSSVHYPRTVVAQPALRSVPHQVYGRLDRAESLAASELSLPIHPYLMDDEIARVVDAVNKFVVR